MNMLGIDCQAQTMGVYVFRTDIWWVWPTRLLSRSGDQVVCGCGGAITSATKDILCAFLDEYITRLRTTNGDSSMSNT